ncbi:MAG: hypothetical protein B6247_04000 [Candidatus Parabeggiatoa sp. nov. 2]|nr:MAG: hypothetical protein B6247_04000 [Beggiatoa sp. 4572_84]
MVEPQKVVPRSVVFGHSAGYFKVFPQRPTANRLIFKANNSRFSIKPQSVLTTRLRFFNQIALSIKPQNVVNNRISLIIPVLLNIRPKKIRHQLNFKVCVIFATNPLKLKRHSVNFNVGNIQVISSPTNTRPHSTIFKEENQLVLTARRVQVHQVILNGNKIKLLLILERTVSQAITFFVGDGQLIAGKCRLFHARCAQLISGCDLKKYFNLAPEIPDDFLNKQIVEACLALYRDTGLPMGTCPVDKLIEWQTAQRYLALAYALPHLNTFTLQGAARSERLAALARFMEPHEVAQQIAGLKARYNELVVFIRGPLEPSNPFEWVAI